ncbi:winged helix-turn-helix domain-containing protein [Shewanella nanhaiensis]|uniref:Helix-turn-helix domain-containing protein n=1 Tax=Shewanella nanhaiensis TaxID=2864872 RepID=A0ABS7E028_9GAMM|nr:helix-turn-helix domain-containing protein [Shewanella nanhaiensis]MBW8183015.1 helix-turn-helix domain-containing protein [Shewanella nanhaiensis]
MQIGSCWFDINSKTLSNLGNDTSWKMPAAEFSVLEILVLQRGQVLSREELLASMPEGQQELAQLILAIERVRFYLGAEHAELLETVDKQGYLLHSAPKSKIRTTSSIPFGSISAKHYFIFIALLLGLLWVINSLFVPAVKINSVREQVIISHSSKLSFYPVFSSEEVRMNHAIQIQSLIQTIETCRQVPWEHLFLSISTEDNLISMVLKRGVSAGVEVKNLKIVPLDADWHFIDESWLVKVGVCGE